MLLQKSLRRVDTLRAELAALRLLNAGERGESLNGFVNRAIDSQVEQDAGQRSG